MRNSVPSPNSLPHTTGQFAYDVEGIRFSYGEPSTGSQSWILDGLSFSVGAGEIVGVIGPNGSGKTSLLKLLVKILRPQSGSVRLFGQELDRLPQSSVARLAALVPQDTFQIFPFTIAETVLMGRFPHRRQRGPVIGGGWEGPDDIRAAQQAMEETDVLHVAHRLINEVSGGERQRAIIARALTQEPRVLLLDEPTAHLDLNHQLDICAILRRLKEQRGLSVILVSHDLNLASQYCDRLLLLKEGRILRIGTPTEVIRADVLEAVYHCKVLVDSHPETTLPRVTLPGPAREVTGDR